MDTRRLNLVTRAGVRSDALEEIPPGSLWTRKTDRSSIVFLRLHFHLLEDPYRRRDERTVLAVVTCLRPATEKESEIEVCEIPLRADSSLDNADSREHFRNVWLSEWDRTDVEILPRK